MDSHRLLARSILHTPRRTALVLSLGLLAACSGEATDAFSTPAVTAEPTSAARRLPEPETAAEFLAAGTIAAGEGDVGRTIANYRRAVELEPGNAEAQFVLGTALVPASYNFVLGESSRDFDALDEAIGVLNEACRLDPDNAEYAYWTGRALDLRGDTAGAIAKLEIATKADPEFGQAFKRLGLVHVKNGDVENADAAFAAAMKLIPEDPGLLCQLGNLVLEDDPEQARAHYQSAIDSDFAFTAAYHGLSQALSRLGDPEGAEEARRLKDVYEGHNAKLNSRVQNAAENPRSVEAQFSAGQMYLLLNKPGEAYGMFRKAIDLDKRHVESHYYAGQALVAMGQYEIAMNHFEECAFLAPDRVDVKLELLFVCLELKDQFQGRADELIAELTPRMDAAGADARAAFAEALLFAGKRDEALVQLRAVLAEDPSHETAKILIERAGQ